MTESTQHFNLTKLGSGEGIHDGSGKFPNDDRDLIDALIYHTMNHHHVGTVDSTTPVDAPTLTLNTTGGTFPAGTTVFYGYTHTDPLAGESEISPLATVTTPDPLASPIAPTFTIQPIGGDLDPGSYLYVLTAFVGASTVETLAVNPVEVVIPAGSSESMVTLTLPALHADADGFNVYRRAPNQARYIFIGSTTTGATTFTDDGSGDLDGVVVEWDGGIQGLGNLGRSIPTINTTFGINSIEISHPSTIPVDNTWTIYRSYVEGNFKDSHLVSLLNNVDTFLDTGIGTGAGSPPTVAFTSPDPVLLTGGAEVQGTLPIANVDFVIDEDDMVSDSATKVPTQQSVKAYLTTSLVNKADLVGGVVPTAQMPSISIMNRVAVATQAARLALVNPTNVQVGDVAVQADTGVTWLLIDTDPSVAANWKAIDQSDAVQSVNGQTGTVVLAKTDVGLGNVDNTSDADKPVSTAQQTALNAKVNTADYTAANIVGKFAGTPDGTKFLRDDGTLVTPAGSGSTAVARHLGGGVAPVTIPAAAPGWTSVSSLINTGAPGYDYGTGFTLSAGDLSNGIDLPAGFYTIATYLTGTGGVLNSRLDVSVSFSNSTTSNTTVMGVTVHPDANMLDSYGITTSSTYSIDHSQIDGIVVEVRNHHATNSLTIDWLEVIITKVA